MPRLSNLDRGRALAMLQTGRTQSQVALKFGVSQNTINNLARRYQETSNVADRPRSGCPIVTTVQTDRRIETIATRRKFVTATVIQNELTNARQRRISDQTIRNRLHRAGILPKIPCRVPESTTEMASRIRSLKSCPMRKCHLFCRGQIRFIQERWSHPGLASQRHAARCLQPARSFHGCSAMVWAGISDTQGNHHW